jgi:hypothetical protein
VPLALDCLANVGALMFDAAAHPLLTLFCCLGTTFLHSCVSWNGFHPQVEKHLERCIEIGRKASSVSPPSTRRELKSKKK